jgi:hypothetical protein
MPKYLVEASYTAERAKRMNSPDPTPVKNGDAKECMVFWNAGNLEGHVSSVPGSASPDIFYKRD